MANLSGNTPEIQYVSVLKIHLLYLLSVTRFEKSEAEKDGGFLRRQIVGCDGIVAEKVRRDYDAVVDP